MTLRTHLLLLVAAAVLPVLIFAGIVVATLWQQQRAAYAETYLGNVRALGIAVDAELDGYTRALQALVTDTDLSEPPEARLVARARRTLATQPSWTSIAIADLSGKPALGIGRTVFEPTGGFVDPGLYKKVLASGRPAISGVLRAPGTGALTTQVGVPVMKGNAVTHVIVANVEAASWLPFFSGYPVPEKSTITLVDADGIIIARTLNNERWGGKPASAGFLAALAQQGGEGAFRNVGLDGVSFQSAHRRTKAGWTVASGVPMAHIDAALHGPTYAMVGIGLFAVLLALAAATYLGRRIAQPVGALAQSAQSLARGEAPAPPRARWIHEVEGANRAFTEAARLLRERQDALNEALAREREMRGVAEGASRAKDEFLAMLGHELRNPLNAITAAMAVIDRVAPDSDHAKRSREIVARQSRHLTHLVDDLLDVARVTSGKIVLDRHLVDLGRIVERSVAILKEAGRFGLHPVTTAIGEAWVSGDETRIEQIAVNLLENAVKYTPPGKAIRVRVAGEGSESVFEVSDEGEGIAPDLLPRIFQLFIQGERTLDRAQGGLGLGLTLVKNLVELHDGRVSAHSEGIGRGARFVVRLPRAAAPEHVAEVTPVANDDEKGRRVLLVEDNADSAETLRTLLALRGHDVHVAHDGPAGVALAHKSRPEVALIDIGLPGFDGFEVARRLRASPGGDAIRLVALTGYGQPEDQRAASAAGFDAFLVKPVDFDALHRVFERV
jgi:signal transduction histidine kinase/CheY-like chemotaxis protein